MESQITNAGTRMSVSVSITGEPGYPRFVSVDGRMITFTFAPDSGS